MKKLTQNEFIDRAFKVHGDTYNYTLLKYINKRVKVEIICKKHGSFWVNSDSHLNGNGCKICFHERRSLNKIKKHRELFIEKAKSIHGNDYSYELSEYIKSKIKIKIVCKTHGIFEQMPIMHLSGQGCPDCGRNKKHRIGLNEFIYRSNIIHNDKYDYSKIINFLNSDNSYTIICKKHGEFTQNAKIHMEGSGCPKCIESKGEQKIRNFLEKNKLEYRTQVSFTKCKDKHPLRFDFYLPKFNLLLEYDGIQHFKSFKIFGGINGLKKRQNRDVIKNKFCRSEKIKLLRIKYDEDIVKVLTKFLNID